MNTTNVSLMFLVVDFFLINSLLVRFVVVYHVMALLSRLPSTTNQIPNSKQTPYLRTFLERSVSVQQKGKSCTQALPK